MTGADQPARYWASSSAAETCQWRHLLWLRVHFLVLAATALVSAWNPVDESVDRLVSWVVACLMFAAFAIGLALKLVRIDDAWYRTRACAEGASATAWRLVMKPAEGVAERDAEEERAFLEEFQQLRDRFHDVARYLANHDGGGSEITSAMRGIRAMGSTARWDHYARFRLLDQLEWYRRRAIQNARAEPRWFLAGFVLEGLAVFVAFARVFVAPEFNPNVAIAATAGCVVA